MARTLSYIFGKTNLKISVIGRLLLFCSNFPFQFILAVPMMKKMAARCRTIDDVVELSCKAFSNFPFNILGWAIQSLQVAQEITILLHMLARRRPNLILEIGTAGGGTLFALTRVASATATLLSVDLPSGKFGGGYSAWKTRFYASFRMHYQRVILIRNDSHLIATLDAIKKILGEQKLDFLLIDGDHTYEGVTKDFKMYRNLVAKGGIIAFHDIVPGSPDSVGGVPQFWSEIKAAHNYSEIVKDWNQGACGIGILYI